MNYARIRIINPPPVTAYRIVNPNGTVTPSADGLWRVSTIDLMGGGTWGWLNTPKYQLPRRPAAAARHKPDATSGTLSVLFCLGLALVIAMTVYYSHAIRVIDQAAAAGAAGAGVGR